MNLLFHLASSAPDCLFEESSLLRRKQQILYGDLRGKKKNLLHIPNYELSSLSLFSLLPSIVQQKMHSSPAQNHEFWFKITKGLFGGGSWVLAVASAHQRTY